MRDRDWGVPTLLVIYVGVFGVLALVVGYGFTKLTMTSEESRRRAEHEKTVLNERIESAREIRRALARPVPPPDSLPPITAKPANPEKVAHPKFVASGTPSKKKPAMPKIPAAASNAMAMEIGANAPTAQRNSSFDRAGLNGW